MVKGSSPKTFSNAPKILGGTFLFSCFNDFFMAYVIFLLFRSSFALARSSIFNLRDGLGVVQAIKTAFFLIYPALFVFSFNVLEYPRKDRLLPRMVI